MNSQSLDLGGDTGLHASPARAADATGARHAARDVTLGDFMDDLPVGALHRFVVWVIGVGLFFDMYEIFLVSTIGAALQHEYGLNPQSGDFKLLLASAFIGMFFGAMCVGSLADRIGRSKAFLLTLSWYSAFSVNADMLVICRFLTGIGVGAIYPVADSFLSEILPKARRGRLAAWAYTTSYVAVPLVGYPIGSLLSIPLLNWIERRTLVIGSILSIAVFGLGFAYSGNTALIVCFGVLTTCAPNVFSNAYHVYQAEIFPARVRSTAIGSTYALSRIVSGALPFILLPVLVRYGAGAMFGVISVALGIVAVTLRALGPLTTRRSQDEINPV
ncbi:hypothetical protein WL80_32900 [Burkholderia ubonensis]|uniref:MFS transporter n=1 Tax=Burkholderia ubonensis TaxID=101571 RepID=UPI00075F0299|nr:MFS transporter [Burkholderia ubonensis]KWE98845.1 hypothetical protein WL80_32900 [Burkholderia ubonensis]